MNDWLTDEATMAWMSAIGLLVTVVGFTLTIWQLVRTANAAEASAKAFERSERRMAVSHILLLLPQLHLLAYELDTVAAANDRAHAIRTLASLSRLSTSVAALISDKEDVDGAIIVKLRTVASMASTAKGNLIDSERKLPKSETREVRDQLASLMDEIEAMSLTLNRTEAA